MLPGIMTMHKRSFKRRKQGWGCFFTVAIILVPLLFSVLAYRISIMPVNNEKVKQVSLDVPKSSTTSNIAGLLKENGLIRNAAAFRLYARIKGVDSKLKPGKYMMNTSMAVPDIISQLVEGPPDRISVTIPEGYTVTQIAVMLDEKGICSSSDFIKALNKKWPYPFLKSLPEQKNNLEGYLYPDTYILGSNSGAEKLVEMMLQNFESITERYSYINKAEAMGLTLNQAVTVASMVEREARVDSERTRIAGVIYNRLKIGMPLQIDATVQYALGKSKEKLLYADLEVNSPYNTYKIAGLPPGPIANPGWPSLEAAVKPEKNDYLYYVAKPDGTHAFSKTLAEHNRNVQKFQ